VPCLAGAPPGPRIGPTSFERERVAAAGRVANRDRCKPGRRTEANGSRETPRRTDQTAFGGCSAVAAAGGPPLSPGAAGSAQAEGLLPNSGAAEIGGQHDPRPELG